MNPSTNLADTPNAEPSSGSSAAEIVLTATKLSKTFKTGSALHPDLVSAVDNVDLSLRVGESLGIVGESGCGKSTLARLLVGLDKPSAGTLRYRGHDVASGKRADRRRLRQGVQMIFQDPYTSLDPSMNVQDLVAEPLAATHAMRASARRDRAAELLQMVGMPTSTLGRYPHQFSGGQRQRIGIARALALEPEVLICDEPVSALDVSVQAQVINLLRDLQNRLGVAIVFISHDLSVVRHIADRVCVMYLGRVAETAPTEAIYEHTAHPYTKALLSASPSIEPDAKGMLTKRTVLGGEPPSPINPPSGCRFHPRCPIAEQICRDERPLLHVPHKETDQNHQAACHFAEQVWLNASEDL